MRDSTQPSRQTEDAARGAAIAIIERGNAAPSPPPRSVSKDSAEQQAERLRRLAVELGRSVDA